MDWEIGIQKRKLGVMVSIDTFCCARQQASHVDWLHNRIKVPRSVRSIDKDLSAHPTTIKFLRYAINYTLVREPVNAPFHFIHRIWPDLFHVTCRQCGRNATTNISQIVQNSPWHSASTEFPFVIYIFLAQRLTSIIDDALVPVTDVSISRRHEGRNNSQDVGKARRNEWRV